MLARYFEMDFDSNSNDDLELMGDNGRNASIPSSVNFASSCAQGTSPSPNPVETSSLGLPLAANTSDLPPRPESSSKKSCKLTSDVWEHFDRTVSDGGYRVVCNFCKHELKAGGRNGTSSVRNHLKICPRKTNEDIESSSSVTDGTSYCLFIADEDAEG
ncbi:putative Zinc finger, BED-type [Corchorus capsularis]|uniref:Putative Zinc finger, BED-type n=1 Tax=Corchorus capsularis TaxID=210143 RepID=A0A1R3GY61_COCAP|nr:putative Zinc finger, BED-type [Corchorus capsularis]